MKKTLRNLVIGAVVTAGIFATSTAALAAGTQFVQTDMNFRNGPSTASTIIGSVPAGAQVEVLGSKNGWDLITYNGVTGYICGGNLGDSFTASNKSAGQASQSAQSSSSWRTVTFLTDILQSAPLRRLITTTRSTTSDLRPATRFRSPETMFRAQALAAAQQPTFGYMLRSSVFPVM